jgi:hypothetical protein
LLGPSGAGKSQVGQWLAEALDYLHIEIDRWPDGDGIDVAGIRKEWDAYYSKGSIIPLRSVLQSRAAQADRSGTVLTFPGRLVLPPYLIESSRPERIATIVLYGSGAECLDAFLAREKSEGRGLGVDHWIQNNADVYAQVSRPEYAPYRITAFRPDGRRPSREVIVETIKKRLR